MNTIQKWAEAKNSGLRNTTHEESDVSGNFVVNPPGKMPPGKFKPVGVEVPPPYNKSVSWEPKRWVVWTQVGGIMLTLVALGYVIWLLHQSQPGKLLEEHKKEVTAWLMQQLPKPEVTTQPLVNTIYKKVQSRVEVPNVDKYNMAQLTAWHKLQKYVVDRFYDTPLPPGQYRKMLICGPDGGCKKFDFPDTLGFNRL